MDKKISEIKTIVANSFDRNRPNADQEVNQLLTEGWTLHTFHTAGTSNEHVVTYVLVRYAD